MYETVIKTYAVACTAVFTFLIFTLRANNPSDEYVSIVMVAIMSWLAYHYPFLFAVIMAVITLLFTMCVFVCLIYIKHNPEPKIVLEKYY